MQYQVIYSAKRKTISLQVKQGQVVVRAPYYASETFIKQFVESKEVWLQRQLKCSESRLENQFTYAQGEKLFISGKEKSFNFVLANDDRVIEFEDEIKLEVKALVNAKSSTKQQLTRLLNQWMCQQVGDYLALKLDEYACHMKLSYHSVKVRQYKSRWGSCNNKKQLTFNSLLAMVPKSVFNYVIVHELSHLVHMNHSAAFWQLVACYCPNFKEQKQWLKENQSRLKI